MATTSDLTNLNNQKWPIVSPTIQKAVQKIFTIPKNIMQHNINEVPEDAELELPPESANIAVDEWAAKPVAHSQSGCVLQPSVWYQKDWVYTVDSNGNEDEKQKGKGKGKEYLGISYASDVQNFKPMHVIQEKLQQEIIKGKSQNNGQNFSYEELVALPYLDSVSLTSAQVSNTSLNQQHKWYGMIVLKCYASTGEGIVKGSTKYLYLSVVQCILNSKFGNNIQNGYENGTVNDMTDANDNTKTILIKTNQQYGWVWSSNQLQQSRLQRYERTNS
ncbi:hypothetical protein BT96DRAFT_944305 [Gymnopus androsaceus JB14]|uniref:Uncharacterized protein n=1 Tax=Gymnopus androsaceus JB14 TaxID=1447944 RepID=A0A6A4H5A1_9AGAR|nr:hypothetical protein BT96DRAFT_944305 [Gymnopus androsaceus JB14]